ncbi:hypothetical protein [Pseudomonas syringae]|uniref:hypothetical protein n=1 Tax=Pseudomonas syringae TaxID=317 RepID=UPI00105BA30B|nr:hypothetical protein [Pseudomonas syringae]
MTIPAAAKKVKHYALECRLTFTFTRSRPCVMAEVLEQKPMNGMNTLRNLWSLFSITGRPESHHAT